MLRLTVSPSFSSFLSCPRRETVRTPGNPLLHSRHTNVVANRKLSVAPSLTLSLLDLDFLSDKTGTNVPLARHVRRLTCDFSGSNERTEMSPLEDWKGPESKGWVFYSRSRGRPSATPNHRSVHSTGRVWSSVISRLNPGKIEILGPQFWTCERNGSWVYVGVFIETHRVLGQTRWRRLSSHPERRHSATRCPGPPEWAGHERASRSQCRCALWRPRSAGCPPGSRRDGTGCSAGPRAHPDCTERFTFRTSLNQTAKKSSRRDPNDY